MASPEPAAGARACPGNPFDGHTLAQPDEQEQRAPTMTMAGCTGEVESGRASVLPLQGTDTKELKMAQSSLLGTDRAAAVTTGRDRAALGSSDSSDSGSDRMGLDQPDALDGDETDLPVDVAMRDDLAPGLMAASGMGQAAGAEEDTTVREATDIGVDRIFTPRLGPGDQGADGQTADDDEERDEDEDADLAFIDEAVDPAEDDEPVEPDV